MHTHYAAFTRRPLLRVLICVLPLFLLAAILLLACPFGTPRVLAASLGRAQATTCAQAPSDCHCTNQDPEQQGCAQDAITWPEAYADQGTMFENGVRIGRVERRSSARCHSWWGRVIDTRQAHGGHLPNLCIGIAGTLYSAFPTFVGAHERILYSPMIFQADQPEMPEIQGHLEIDGIAPPASTTLLARPVPAALLTHPVEGRA